jgi:4-cresol dehydrogenase (hydroxylating)
MATTTQRVDETAVQRATEAFARALGEENVLTSEAELREYRDPYDYQGSDEHTASAVVTPASVEDVQAIVRIANEHRVPLWTFGQGRNNTYGGPAPRLRGSVILSMRRMNRVLDVNDELAYAVVEPGVRFFDLHDHLREGGYKLWPSIPDLGWGSVVGNTLEYGRGYTEYGDHPHSACGLEVVLANGELFRTGMGGMANSKCWHAYDYSFGPTHTGLFMQSNFGIVTKMGVWLMPQPELTLSCWATFGDDSTIAPAIDALRRLMLEGTIRNTPNIASGLTVGGGRTNTWRARFALYGHAEVVEMQYEIARVALERAGGEVTRRAFRGDERLAATEHDDKVHTGVPGMELMDIFKEPYGDFTGHIDLSPIVPFVGKEVADSVRLLRSLYAKNGLPYLGGIILFPRSALHITTIMYDTRQEEQTRHAFRTYGELVLELSRAGYPLYRTNIQHMDLVADQFDFNDHAQRRMNEQLKDVLDPNGILSPGKSGIWPKAMRPERSR